MENFISCAVKVFSMKKKKQTDDLKISVNSQLQWKFTEDLPKYLEQLLFKKNKSLFMAYTPQTAITSTKLTIKTLEQSVKYVQS